MPLNLKEFNFDMSKFDWHSGLITKNTQVTDDYRNTQNVRRYLKKACGPGFKFDREFMAWIKNGQPKTMGDVTIKWLRKNENT